MNEMSVKDLSSCLQSIEMVLRPASQASMNDQSVLLPGAAVRLTSSLA
jgi:hypothetical protein